MKTTSRTQKERTAHRAPPALRHRKESTRKYTVVSAAAAWDVMVKARASRANLRQALRLRDDAAELGCADRQADRRIEARNVMYFDKMTALFTQLDHWNLVADPGTHSYREVMPAALYGRNMDMVGFCPFQRLLPAKAGVTPGDTELHPTIVPHVKTMTLTRVATFRQVQGPYLRFGVVGRGASLPE